MNLKGWPFEPLHNPEPTSEGNGGGPGAPG